ncbi:MAG: fatty acid desaturase, partial [Bacteroidota bacterium]|nr:fatty acid desaturase [Bacteroidota bacterium]
MKIAKGSIRFSRKDKQQFFSTLNKRVNAYFKDNNLRKTGNWKLHLKTVILITLFVTPYVLLLSLDLSEWVKLGLCVLLGFGMAGIGMNVMHEGNHGSYSRYGWVNKIMGGAIYILAGNVFNWKVQHNVLHHSFTNIHGHDEDLEAGTVMRFSKHAKWRAIHRFQHFYFIVLYGLMTLRWVITTDF